MMEDFYYNSVAMDYVRSPTPEKKVAIIKLLNTDGLTRRQRSWLLNGLRKYGHDRGLSRCLFCGKWFQTLQELPDHIIQERHGRVV